MNKQPALKAVLILIVGIIAGRTMRVDFTTLLVFSILLFGITIALFISKKVSRLVQFFLALSFISIGFIRYQQAQLLPGNHITHFVTSPPKIMTLRGYLTKDPIAKPGKIELIIESLTLRDGKRMKPIRGKVLVSVYQDKPIHFHYGDVLLVTGQLQRPKGRRNPGGFDYRATLARKDIHTILLASKLSPIQRTGEIRGSYILRKVIYPVRRYVLQTINKTMSQSTRPLLRALLIGEKGNIPPELRDSFAKAGIMHVLAVSGLHVGFVLIILTTVLGLLRIPYPARVLLIILGLIFYVLLTEAKDPVVRAAIMAGVYLVGTLIERQTIAFNVIGVAALTILLIRPQDLFDAGFQLSFIAVSSIVYFYQKLRTTPFLIKLHQHFSKKAIGKTILTLFLISLAAQIGIIPLVAYYFNRIPLLSLFVNIFTIPIVGLIVALGFTSVILGILSPWIAAVYGALNQELVTLFYKVISWIGSMSFSHITVPSPNILLISSYFFLMLFLFNLRSPMLRKRFVFLLLIGLNLSIWKAALAKDGCQMTWIQFDVGQGDAAILHLPRGKTLLFDGGDKHPFFDNGERVIAPYLRRKGIRKIDIVFLSHPHDDHVGGLIYILNHFKIGEIIMVPTRFGSDLYQRFQGIANDKKIPVRWVTGLDSLELPGVKFFLFSPKGNQNQMVDQFDDVNNRSLIVRVLYGKTRLLFMGDAEKQAEEDILFSGRTLTCDGIKVGHHGSTTSSTFPFLQRVRPKHAVISVGEHNRFRHPSMSVIGRFQLLGSAVHRTDREGAILLRSDGKKLEHVNWR